MGTVRYRFECRDVADCDVVIYSELRESIVEATRAHLLAVHGLEVSDTEVESYIEEV